jgi:cardiolipin synthase A/B
MSGGEFFTTRAIGGNTLRMLPTGGFIDQARQALIRGAQRSISISAYAWEDDEAGRGFFGLVTERAQAGIDVKIVVDNFGARSIRKYQQMLRADGVRLLFFNPGALWYPQHWIMGMHEKLLIVDGQHLVMGGSGWSHPYRVSSRDSDVWYDLDVQIEGPAAAWFHNSFNELWQRASMVDRDSDTSAVTHGPTVGADEFDDGLDERRAAADYRARYGVDSLYTATAPSVGSVALLPLHGNPLFTDERPILDTYLAAIAATADGGRIRLYSPYCVPVPKLIDALLAARARGVSVEILTNSLDSTDGGGVLIAGMYEATRSLRAAGVGVHLWPRKSLMHRKGGVFDGRWCYFGSDNLDRRGTEKQTETVVFTDDAQAVAAMAAALDADLALAPALTPADEARDLARIGGFQHSLAVSFLNQLITTIKPPPG